MTLTTQDLARDALTHFAPRVRPGGESFYVLRVPSPEWVLELAHDAHRNGADMAMLPDDRIYELVVSALEHIAELSDPLTDEDLHDAGHEWADSQVDVYTADRLRWLASHLSRLSLCDEAADEFGFDEGSISERIAWGQYLEASQVWGSVVQSLGEQFDAETRV